MIRRPPRSTRTDTLFPYTTLCRSGRKDDARRGLRFDLADLDIFARARPGIGALEAVDADDLQPFVLGVRIDRARRRRAFADELDHATYGDRELRAEERRVGNGLVRTGRSRRCP